VAVFVLIVRGLYSLGWNRHVWDIPVKYVERKSNFDDPKIHTRLTVGFSISKTRICVDDYLSFRIILHSPVDIVILLSAHSKQ
jgi:hypothetical protein